MSESSNQTPHLPPSMAGNFNSANCDVDKSNQIQMPMMIAPGNHARAWNDPPMFGVAVNVTGPAKSTRVTKLNKRVAFPLSSTSTKTDAQSSTIRPPNLSSLPQQIPFMMPPNQFNSIQFNSTTSVNFIPPTQTMLTPKNTFTQNNIESGTNLTTTTNFDIMKSQYDEIGTEAQDDSKDAVL